MHDLRQFTFYKILWKLVQTKQIGVAYHRDGSL